MSEYIVRMPPDMPYEIRAELNAWYVESEPIVRCRDCKFSIYNGERCTFWKRTEKVNDYEYMDVAAEVEPDGFCAWGERNG